MSNVTSSRRTSAGALDAFARVLEAMENNVSNASTPGHAQQGVERDGLSFDPALGDSGGVNASRVVSARNEYAEQAVRRQTALLGEARQNAGSLTALQSVFDITGNWGMPNALNNLLQSFSAWGQTPHDAVARQKVITHATDLANAFQQTAAGLANVTEDIERQLQQTVDQVNQLLGQLRGYNQEILQGDRHDAALDAQVHAILEQLSQYADFTTMQQEDGAMSLLLNGQTPLLAGDRKFDLACRLQQPDNPPAVYPGAPPRARILGSDGTDITANVTSGQLGALVDLRNRVLPSYIGDAYRPGDLNTMAKQFADRVNQLLMAGNVSEGPLPVPGAALFAYNAGDETHAAETLSVDPNVTADQLAATDPGPPLVSNGIPQALSRLSDPQQGADEIGGASYSAFYGDMAARIGSQLEDANTQLSFQQSAVAQAKYLRQQMSGVPLDEEATILIQLQRASEANSRVVTVLDQLTQDTLNMLQA